MLFMFKDFAGGKTWVGLAYWVHPLDTGWTDWSSNAGGGRDFSAPIQTGPGARPDSCTMRTVCFPVVKRLGRGVDHGTPRSSNFKERLEVQNSPPPPAFMGC
jgi:hypothetical protein